VTSSAFASVRPAGRRPTAVRPRADHDLVSSVSRRLTLRDRLLCRTLFDYKVLTTEQVTELCFANLTTARHRLTALYDLQVLDRFRPFRPVGSDPYHYVLDTLGVEVVAADRASSSPDRDCTTAALWLWPTAGATAPCSPSASQRWPTSCRTRRSPGSSRGRASSTPDSTNPSPIPPPSTRSRISSPLAPLAGPASAATTTT
jgi:hypothetical protein